MNTEHILLISTLISVLTNVALFWKHRTKKLVLPPAPEVATSHRQAWERRQAIRAMNPKGSFVATVPAQKITK